MTPNDIVAQVVHEQLDPGPMSRTVRAAAYRAFIEANFIDTPAAPVFESTGTHCAIFGRGCLVQAEVKPRRGRPSVTAITTWLGVTWFGTDWLPLDKALPLIPGDILYWAGYRGQRNWKDALNGHVGILCPDGNGWDWIVGQGGGGDGSRCSKTPTPVDVRESWNRPLRGVWRPNRL